MALERELIFRRLLDGDIRRLADFFERNNDPSITRHFHPFPLTGEYARTLIKKADRDLFFAAESGDEFLGFSMLRGLDEGCRIPSFGILVDREHHGNGIGSRLTEWTLRWADQTNTDQVRLSVYGDNNSARSIYESLGFRETERTLGADGRERIIMHRSNQCWTMPVYVSTSCLGFKDTFERLLENYFNHGILRVECTNHPNIVDPSNLSRFLETGPLDLLIHNYFPPRGNDFVLNLASPNPATREETGRFLREAIAMSSRIGGKWYSFHAGFAGDPVGRNDYGFAFAPVSEENRGKAFRRFSEELVSMDRYAAKWGVQILVENNVSNASSRGDVLLATPEEFSLLRKVLPTSVDAGILLDLGHMKVSSKSYGFDPDDFIRLNEQIRGVHLHDNNGMEDQHLPIDKTNWSIDFARRTAPDYVSLEGHYRSMTELQTSLLKIERSMNE